MAGESGSLDVAIKELKPPGADEDYYEKFEEFKRETFIMSSLNHQNLVKLYGITLSPKMTMVMEFIAGGDLRHKFHAHDPQLESERAILKKEEQQLTHDNDEFMKNLKNFSEIQKQEKFKYFAMKKQEIDHQWEVLTKAQQQIDQERISWRLKYKVSLDVAMGMKHLHSIVPPVIHRDLRSPNVFVRFS